MFGSDGLFGNKKTNTPTDTPENIFEPVNGTPEDEKPKRIKSLAAIGIIVLLLIGILGLNNVVSDAARGKKSKKKKMVSNDFVIDDYDVPADFASFKKDADAYKEKQGFFSSFFCGGYQKSSFCK